MLKSKKEKEICNIQKKKNPLFDASERFLYNNQQCQHISKNKTKKQMKKIIKIGS